jgi:hypothetical protein
MSTSPTDIIPEELMDRSQKKAVIAFLVNAPAEAKLKKALLLGWAQAVGVRLQAREYRTVEQSGIDKEGPGSYPNT